MRVHCSVGCLATCIFTVPYFSHRLTVTFCIHKNTMNIRNYMRDWKLTFYFLATNAISGQKSVCGKTQKYCKLYFEEAYELKALKKK